MSESSSMEHPGDTGLPPSQLLKALSSLAVEGVHQVTDVVEHAHWRVLRNMKLAPDAPAERTRGLTGLVYRSVNQVTQRVGQTLDVLLPMTEGLIDGASRRRPGLAEQTARAVLNGVMGDKLEAMDNALAIPMSLRPLAANTDTLDESLSSRPIAVLAHGLCMGAHQWKPSGEAEYQGLGHWLQECLGYRVFLLNYNSGRSLTDNGQQLAELLEQAFGSTALPEEEGPDASPIVLLGYSMGGLLMRAACNRARSEKHRWLERLSDLVLLGTPNHGAPLEKAGHGLHWLLESNAQTLPYARLAHLRSEGITDLRKGLSAPLPTGVSCYAVAATLAKSTENCLANGVGDGLVPVKSALGLDDSEDYRLHLPKEHRAILYETGHLALLHSDALCQVLSQWIEPAGDQPG